MPDLGIKMTELHANAGRTWSGTEDQPDFRSH